MEYARGAVRHLFGHTVRHVALPESEVRAHIADVAPAMLLLCAVHVTGDPALLDKYGDRVGPFETPALMFASEAHEIAPADPVARQELIELLVTELTAPHHTPYTSFCEDEATFQRMSRIAAGPAFDPNHLGLNQEMCGFAPEALTIRTTDQSAEDLGLVILGAGMGGLDAAVKAADRGIPFEILEMQGGVGGLWWSQRYPGVAVDTPTIMYSLSWELSPEWTRYFPAGTEYRDYLNAIADKYSLRDHLRLNSEVTRMEWLDDEHVWELTVRSTIDDSVRTIRSAAVLTAAGNLCRPKYPDVEGIDTFSGTSLHTATWQDVDLRGKRVAVVGVGAAGLQVIAAIAPQVGELTAFQRQAHWVLPNTYGEGTVDAEERWRLRHLPYYKNWQRLAAFAATNKAAYEMNQWDAEWAANDPTSINPVNAAIRDQALDYIHACFGEASELAAKLTPDFPFGAKRPVRDPADFVEGGYYWALAQPHVNVVTTPVSRVVPEGIVTSDGQTFELDVIIWATGMTIDNLVTIDVLGRDGVQLRDLWADDSAWQGPRTYLGGTVPGFPNLFVTDGPNTGVALGGASHNYMVETMNHYILECVDLLRSSGARSMEVSQEAFDAYQVELDRHQAGLMWANESNAHTYYRNSSGRAFFANPFEVSVYWQMNRDPDPEAFILRPALPDSP